MHGEVLTMRFDDLYQAEAALKDLCSASNDPMLEDHEIRDIVMSSRTYDSDGRLVTETGYELTVDLNKAGAEAWLRKACKAAGLYDFSSDNQRFSRSQILNHCQRMALSFQRKQMASWRAKHNAFARDYYGRTETE